MRCAVTIDSWPPATCDNAADDSVDPEGHPICAQHAADGVGIFIGKVLVMMRRTDTGEWSESD